MTGSFNGKFENKIACPVCESLALKYPEIVKYFDFEHNDFSPSEIEPYAKIGAYWKCPNGHQFYKKISQVTGAFVRNSNKTVLCAECESLAYKFPELSKWFNEKENHIPSNQVAAFSKHTMIWNCPNGHSFSQTVANVANAYNRSKSKIIYCPVCRNLDSNK
jgi:hypothetical protein